MRISRVYIENFRNFKQLDVELGQNIILVGENKSGKSNFIEAIRLVLDPSLSDSDRQLTEHDFWDGDGELPFNGREIKIEVQFTDFADEESPEYLPLSWLCDCLISSGAGKIAQLTYIYSEDKSISSDNCFPGSDDYSFKIHPGGKEDKNFNIKGLRRDIPLHLIKALRDIASDNKIWHQSPLKRLLKLVDLPSDKLKPYSDNIKEISEKVVGGVEPLKLLETEVMKRIDKMIGSLHKISPQLGIGATTPETLLEALRVFADGSQRRPLDRISLGLQNVLYLSLLSLMLEKKEINRNKKKEAFMPIVALEEPEAHLHPHLQRLVFSDFLKEAQKRKQPVLISTHSPHLVSTASVADLVLLKNHGKDGCQATSAYKFIKGLSDRPRKDIERFLDITKSEMMFAKGVIFVEGDVEAFLIPEFAKILGNPLDRFGISVCNVYGTHFQHIVKLASELEIPFVVFTDGDKFIDVTGLDRSKKLCESLRPSDSNNIFMGKSDMEICALLNENGIFINDWTLEVSLIQSGLTDEFKKTFEELSTELNIKSTMGNDKIESYLNNPTDDNMKSILNAVGDSRWGKGRFAQRLINHIVAKSESMSTQNDKNNIIPEYIKNGIEFLIDRTDLKLENN
jgi:putative ATP-dependent endonuclease of the OLD family